MALYPQTGQGCVFLLFWPVPSFPGTKSSGWGFQRRVTPLPPVGHLTFGLQTDLLEVLEPADGARAKNVAGDREQCI